jgi:hypothetical protein
MKLQKNFASRGAYCLLFFLLFGIASRNGKCLSLSSTFCFSLDLMLLFLSDGREEVETCKPELVVVETCILVQDGVVLVKDGMDSLVVVTCKRVLVVVEICILVQGGMTSLVVVVTGKRVLVVVETYKLVQDDMASLVMVVTCKRVLVVVETYKLVWDDMVLVEDSMAS